MWISLGITQWYLSGLNVIFLGDLFIFKQRFQNEKKISYVAGDAPVADVLSFQQQLRF